MYDPNSTYILPPVSPVNSEEAVQKLSPEERDQRIAQKQLMVSLKFHHRELLKKLSLEMSLEAIAEVWYSLQPDD